MDKSKSLAQSIACKTIEDQEVKAFEICAAEKRVKIYVAHQRRAYLLERVLHKKISIDIISQRLPMDKLNTRARRKQSELRKLELYNKIMEAVSSDFENFDFRSK